MKMRQHTTEHEKPMAQSQAQQSYIMTRQSIQKVFNSVVHSAEPARIGIVTWQMARSSLDGVCCASQVLIWEKLGAHHRDKRAGKNEGRDHGERDSQGKRPK